MVEKEKKNTRELIEEYRALEDAITDDLVIGYNKLVSFDNEVLCKSDISYILKRTFREYIKEVQKHIENNSLEQALTYLESAMDFEKFLEGLL